MLFRSTTAFNVTLPTWVNNGDKISATATVDLGGGNYGSTSEFGVNVTASATGVLVVDTASDVSDGTVTSINNLVNNRGADGRISLREAIAATNATAGADLIVFDIPGSGPHIINVTGTPLPTITGQVTIDGWSEPDYTGDRKSTRLNSSHSQQSRMPSSA